MNIPDSPAKRIYLIFFLFSFSALSPLKSFADTYSIFTIGAGTQLGVSHYKPFNDTTASGFVGEMSVRAKFLYCLGIDFSFKLSNAENERDNLAFLSRYRISALLYPVVTDYFSLYFTGGIGANDFSRLAVIKLEENSYHTGGGIEVYLSSHVAVTGEFLVLMPSYSSVQNVGQIQAALEMEKYNENPKIYIPPDF